MYYSSNSPKISTDRSGLQDIWNAFMVEEAVFSINDIPLCPTTATAPPTRLIPYDEAKTVHGKELRNGNPDYHVDAFIHFYIDDHKFDGKQSSIWLYPEKALEIIRHYSGIIAPDFSTCLDFPKPLKLWNFYRMNAFVTAHGNGRGQTNAYIEGENFDVGADIFRRGLCLPSDNKMTIEEQDRIIEIIRRCFK